MTTNRVLATSSTELRSAGTTILGRCRAANEDAWAKDESGNVFIVADGCGGVSSGRAAADAAIAAVQDCLSFAPQGRPQGLPSRIEPLAAAIYRANEEIVRTAVGDKRGMGCAVAAVRFDLPWLVTVHVGDCRIYRYRRGYDQSYQGADVLGGVLSRLTMDHDLRAEIVRSGGSASEVREVSESCPNVITRALGIGELLDVDTQYRQVVLGDLFLLCTDGVTRQLPDDRIKSIISEDTRSLAERCDGLVQVADAASGHDNVTAILIQVGRSAETR